MCLRPRVITACSLPTPQQKPTSRFLYVGVTVLMPTNSVRSCACLSPGSSCSPTTLYRLHHTPITTCHRPSELAAIDVQYTRLVSICAPERSRLRATRQDAETEDDTGSPDLPAILEMQYDIRMIRGVSSPRRISVLHQGKMRNRACGGTGGRARKKPVLWASIGIRVFL